VILSLTYGIIPSMASKEYDPTANPAFRTASNRLQP
jgi:hypothetical protein